MNMRFALSRNRFGRLVLELPDGARHEGVVPVRAFPISAPTEGVALVAGDGHELVWIPALAEVEEPLRVLIEEELAGREFMPEITRIVAVSGYATPSVWTVDTDRGTTRLTLRGEEDIRPLGTQGVLITDAHGIQFLIRDLTRLNRASRRILDRFL
jgi:hypothetical protein